MELVVGKYGDKGGNDDTLPSGSVTTLRSSFTGVDIVNGIQPGGKGKFSTRLPI